MPGDAAPRRVRRERWASRFEATGRGTYVLVLSLARARTVRVGSLGGVRFRAGWYAYVGSALGSGGLSGRLGRYFEPPRRMRWHIDYLCAAAAPREVWYSGGGTRREHEWAALLGDLPGSRVAVRAFGSSDCACPAHLFHFRGGLGAGLLRRWFRARFPEEEPPRRVRLHPAHRAAGTWQNARPRGGATRAPGRHRPG